MAEPDKPKDTEKPLAADECKEAGWYYHKEHEPKLLKKGEKIPEGWSHKNSFGWYKDPKMNFSWRKK